MKTNALAGACTDISCDLNINKFNDIRNKFTTDISDHFIKNNQSKNINIVTIAHGSMLFDFQLVHLLKSINIQINNAALIDPYWHSIIDILKQYPKSTNNFTISDLANIKRSMCAI